MITILVGIVCFISGFGLCMYAQSQMARDSFRRYEHATARWDAGTNEYRKAAEKLQEYLKKSDENEAKVKKILTDLRTALTGHVPEDVLAVLFK